MTEENKRTDKIGKNKSIRRKSLLRDYALQLLVVVIGILITFQGTAWVAKRSERNQMREILESVKKEMELNTLRMDQALQIGQNELAGMDFFRRYINDINKAPADSLNSYISLLRSNRRYEVTSDALEVLKTSSNAVNVMDKGLLQGIFSAYNTVGVIFQNINYYYIEKTEVIKTFHAATDIDITGDPRKQPYKFVGSYFGSPASRNFLLNAPMMLKPNLSVLELVIKEYGDAVEEINDYISGKIKHFNE